ncbi:MAG: hypothetical protein JEY79_07360 [Pseudodesulfovibrio sp.]|nr:hypothetical protein [Pseudodesulfovibrio sp.]
MGAVYIHVGYGRTATTFMQKHVFHRLKGIQYFNKKESLFIKSYTLSGDDRFRERAMELEMACDGKPMFFTDEGLIAHSPYSQLPRLKDIFPDATIVLTIRNQMSYLYSRYAHEVTRGYLGQKYWDVPEYSEWIGMKGGLLSGLLSYNMMYAAIKKLFTDVRVLFFEEYVKDWSIVATGCDCEFDNQIPVEADKDKNASAHKINDVIDRYNHVHSGILSGLFFRLNSDFSKSRQPIKRVECTPEDILDANVAGSTLRDIYLRENILFQEALGRNLPPAYFWKGLSE